MMIQFRAVSLSLIFKVDVVIAPGTHESEAAVNKQLAVKLPP